MEMVENWGFDEQGAAGNRLPRNTGGRGGGISWRGSLLKAPAALPGRGETQSETRGRRAGKGMANQAGGALGTHLVSV